MCLSDMINDFIVLFTSLFLPLRKDAIIEIIRTMNNQSVDNHAAPSDIAKQILYKNQNLWDIFKFNLNFVFSIFIANICDLINSF